MKETLKTQFAASGVRWFCLLLIMLSVTGRSLAQNSIATLLQQLANPEAAIRMGGFYALLDSASIAQDSTIPEKLQDILKNNPAQADQIELTLINALTLENVLVEMTDSESSGDLAEDYTEYYADLIFCVGSMGDKRSIPPLVDAVKSGGIAITAVAGFGSDALGPIVSSLDTTDELRNAALGFVLIKMTQAADFQNAFSVSEAANIRAALQRVSAQGDSYVQSKIAQAAENLNKRIVVKDAPTTSNSCNGVYKGISKRNVIVSDGQACTFIEGGISGNLVILGGIVNIGNSFVGGDIHMYDGSLTVTGNSRIKGRLHISGGQQFFIGPSTVIDGSAHVRDIKSAKTSYFCGASVKGDMRIRAVEAAVQIGSEALCAGNSIEGHRVEIDENRASVSMAGNTIVGSISIARNESAVVITKNTADGDLEVDDNKGSIQILTNTIIGQLSCRENDSISGADNMAALKRGQCAHF